MHADLEDNHHEGFNEPAVAVRQHARSFFEVEELLPDELAFANQSVWSSWCTGLAKQLRSGGAHTH